MENLFDQDDIFLQNDIDDDFEDVEYLTDDEYFDKIQIEKTNDDLKSIIEKLKK